MTFEELAIGYAIIDTAFTGGERFRSVYGWFDKTINAECEALEASRYPLKKMILVSI